MTILVVEDNDLVRLLLLELLEEQSGTAVGVADGSAALDYLQTSAERPTLIILDLMMPTMDDWAVCAALCRDPALATIPIMVTTARRDIADQADRLGAVEYPTKPFEADALGAIVQRYSRALRAQGAC